MGKRVLFFLFIVNKRIITKRHIKKQSWAMHTSIFFIILFCVVVVFDVSFQTTLDSIIPCPTFVPTPLTANPTAIEELRTWCAAVPECSEKYGQSITPKVDLFETLFQTTTESFTPPLYLESPVLDLLCGNITYRQFMTKTWPSYLLKDILDRGLACNEGKTPLKNPDTGEIYCGDFPWTQVASISGFSFLGLTIEILIFVLLLIAIAFFVLNYTKKR